MGEAEVIKLFKCLADKSRLQILRSLLSEDMYVERLAQRLELTPATISFHMKKLEDAGAVRSYKDQYYTMYSINREIFRGSVLELIRAAPMGRTSRRGGMRNTAGKSSTAFLSTES